MGNMREPSELYRLRRPADEVPRGLPLVAAITGFTDAGGAVQQVTEYLLDALDAEVVVEFDGDALLDYRARRPILFFDETRFTEYRRPELAIRLARDELGAPFLLMTGYEPDFRWESFTDAVVALVEQWEVASTTWINAIPMPVPHTRPIGSTVSGNRDDLTDAHSIWRPQTQVPGNAMHLLEYKLQEAGQPVAGFVLLIPHYLGDTEYPAAAVAALESITAATGLLLPTDRLREEGREFLAKVDDQVEGNSELQRLVGTLEERHDSYMEENALRSPLTGDDGEVPSADSIAAELEKFLAHRRRADDD